jgi:hypothetical protein
MALPGERPPNRLAAALIGGVVRSFLGGAETARGAGALHCTLQYASVADKAKKRQSFHTKPLTCNSSIKRVNNLITQRTN